MRGLYRGWGALQAPGKAHPDQGGHRGESTFLEESRKRVLKTRREGREQEVSTAGGEQSFKPDRVESGMVNSTCQFS